jgi:hypothetical protein
LTRALYRSRQVLHALRPRIDSTELAQACVLLNEGEARIFFSMQPRDQRHALEVAQRLRDAGATNQDLLVAALLHDCGKGAVPVWLRIAWVAMPGLVRAIAKEGTTGLPAAAYRLINHPALGGRRAEAAGSSPTTVRLVEGHPTADEAPLAAQLRTADDAS